MRLVIVRHYKTEINAQHRIMGWGDSPPVKGWEQDLLAVLERLQQLDIRFDAVYTSGLNRARVTGEFYANRLGVEVLCSDEALNEVNYGKLFKKSKKWVAAHVPEYKTDPGFIFPAGESFSQMQQRSVGCVERLIECEADCTLLLVVHAGVVRGLICHFLQLPYAPNLKRRISHRYIGDFLFEDGRCRSYGELGSYSDFVKEKIVLL